MTVVGRFWRTFFIGSAVTLALATALLVTQKPVFVGLMLVSVFATSYLSERIRCPRCRTPILWKGVKVGDKVIRVAYGMPPLKCATCGYPIGEEDSHHSE
jgi:DNA-directed RNA polymerase subunit RPC12/RpoP